MGMWWKPAATAASSLQMLRRSTSTLPRTTEASLLEIERAELVPFGHDRHRIGPFGSLVGRLCKRDTLEHRCRMFHAGGVVSPHDRAVILQRARNRQRGCCAHVRPYWP